MTSEGVCETGEWIKVAKVGHLREVKAKGRKIDGSKKNYELREPAIYYRANFIPEHDALRLKKTYSWDDII